MAEIPRWQIQFRIIQKKLCLPYVWMPPVQTQHKESMLCQTKGVSICPIHLYAPCMFRMPQYVWRHLLYVGMPPICLDMAPVCLDAPLYVWMPPVCFGHSPYVWMHPICLHDVWMPLYMYNTKKPPVFRLRGCPDTPIHVWKAPI